MIQTCSNAWHYSRVKLVPAEYWAGVATGDMAARNFLAAICRFVCRKQKDVYAEVFSPTMS